MTMNAYTDDFSAVAQLSTSNASWTPAVDLYVGGAEQPAIIVGVWSVVCTNPATGACASWEQPVALQCDDDVARYAGLTLPSLRLLQKDVALLFANIEFDLDGAYHKCSVKGVASTDLQWLVSFRSSIGLGGTP